MLPGRSRPCAEIQGDRVEGHRVRRTPFVSVNETAFWVETPAVKVTAAALRLPERR